MRCRYEEVERAGHRRALDGGARWGGGRGKIPLASSVVRTVLSVEYICDHVWLEVICESTPEEIKRVTCSIASELVGIIFSDSHSPNF